MLSTDLQLSLLHAKVGNLEFSNVMLSTDLQLSLLHAKVRTSGIFKCNVLY